jgi:nucleoside-diphosphate-sugar epimerase
MVENHRPELVFHLAAAVSAREDLDLVLPMLRANLNGSVHLLKALYGTVCQRVVQAGTYEEGRDGEVPGSPYGVAKACARLYANFFAQHHGLQVVHARLDLTYGPHQPEHRLIAYLIRTVLAGQTPALKTPQRRYGYLYLDDAVAALIECATTPGLGGCTVDVTGDERISVADVALLLEETIRSTGAPAVWPAPREAGTPADPRWTWRPQVSLVEGLKRTLDYYQREKERSLAACR